MSGGPKWCELFIILYRTQRYRLFRIFTFEQILLTPIIFAKHWVVMTVLEYSCVVIFATNNWRGRYTEIVTGHYFSIVAR